MSAPRAGLAVLALLAGSPAFGEEPKPTYWDVAGDSAPVGQLVVRVPPARPAPAGWKVNWFLSLYTPGGYRLPLGAIEDIQKPGDGSRLVLKLPAGAHRIELTRPSSTPTAGLGALDISAGKFVAAKREAIVAANLTVTIDAGQVQVVEIRYQNPQAVSGEQGDSRTEMFTWENLSLQTVAGSPADLPSRSPRPFPLLQGTSLAGLDHAHLVKCLKDKESKWLAEQVLLKRKNPPIEPILAALRDKTLVLDWGVAEILGRSRPAAAVPVLATLCREAPEPEARAAAALALGEIGDPAGLESLKAALADKKPLVRNVAVLALGRIKSPETVAVLLESTKDKAELSCELLFSTLDEIPRFLCLTKEGTDLTEVVPLPHFSVRLNAVYALGQTGDPQALDLLLGYLKDKDTPMRVSAISGLVHFRVPKARETLTPLLEPAEPQVVRWLAAQVLGEIGDAGVVEALAKVAKQDPDKMVKAGAEDAVAKIRKRLAAPTPAPSAPAPAKAASPPAGAASGLLAKYWLHLLLLVLGVLALAAALVRRRRIARP